MSEPFNREELLERVGGDRELLAEIVEAFRNDCPAQLARIREAVQAGDARGLYRAAHALKGAMGNLAAGPAVERALELETMGREARLQDAEATLNLLEQEAAHVVSALVTFAAGTQTGVRLG